MDGRIAYTVCVIVAVGVLSWLIRALPFLLFGRGGEPPKVVSYIGRVLSPAAMAMLVVYCFVGYLKDRPFADSMWNLAEIASGALTVALQWKWRSPLLSIAAGTALYMLLVGG